VKWRRLSVVAGAGAVLLVGGFAVRPSAATVAAACSADVGGTLKNLSRTIVPVGLPATRFFTAAADDPVSALQLSAPGGRQVAGQEGAAGITFTAPRAGPFRVQASWTVQTAGGSCAASATATLNAASGTPLVIKTPPVRRFPGVKVIQYDAPVRWTWACSAESDPAPVTATIRWEVETRALPLFSRGGKPPFKFTKRAKSFTVTSAEPCDFLQAGEVVKALPHGAKLTVQVFGKVEAGSGVLYLLQRGGFRRGRSPAAFHLGVTLRQGSRTLLDRKLCSWSQTAFLLADRAGVTCWW
jgi:hypothetical protein